MPASAPAGGDVRVGRAPGVGGDQRGDPRAFPLAGLEVNAAGDVDVAAALHDDLIETVDG